MGKKPRQWSPDGLKYLMIVNPFAWRNPPDGSSRNVTPGHLIAWINHALGSQEGDSVVQELAWRAKTGTREAILVGIDESVDIKRLLGEHRWSEFGRSLSTPDSSYIFETKYESLAHACGADSWKRVESDLQRAGVGDMFKKPYPRPYWADSKKQCAGMNSQVSAQVKTMQARPQPELQDARLDPSREVSRPPPVAASVLEPSESESTPYRPSDAAYTGLMPPVSAQTSQMAQGGYPSPRGASSQGSPRAKQEPLENLVHHSIAISRSSSALPNTPVTQVLFSTELGQSRNRHSNTPHGMVHTTSVSEVPGNGHEHPAPMKLDATAEVPEPRVKMEVSEGPVASVEQTTAAYAAYLARRSAAQASIPTTSFTQAPPISPRYAQAQPRGTPCVPPPSSTPETPTTHVKTEPLGHTFETPGVSLPAAKFELTTTVQLPAITRPETVFTPEQSNRFSVKTEQIDLVTNLTPPVVRSGTSLFTDCHSQAQGTSINVTAPLNPKIESRTDGGGGLVDSTLSTPSSTLNKRKNTSTGDRDRLSKRAKLSDGSR